MKEIALEDCSGFEWDDGNAAKSWVKHGISQAVCEQVFFNHPLLLLEDQTHSKHEPRFHALGHANDGQRLFIAFTIRNGLIRVISARPMSKKERGFYDQA